MGKLRAGSESAIRLMDSDDQNEWEAALRSYPRSVKRLSEENGKSGLVELDQWWRSLPEVLASREANEGGAYLSKDDLIRVVQWKLWIGANRPSLLAYAKATDEKKVKAKSIEAFQHLPRHPSPPLPPSSAPQTPSAAASGTADAAPRASRDAVKTAVKTLSSDIKGVGPATASAVLAAWCGGCPFDADEVIDAVRRTGKREYSLNEYLEVHETLDAKAASLGGPWDAERVRKALWSRAVHSRFAMAVPAVTRPTPPTDTAATAGSSVTKATPSSSSPDSKTSASSRHRSGGRAAGTTSSPSGSKSSSSSSSGKEKESSGKGVVGRPGGVAEDRGARRPAKKQKS